MEYQKTANFLNNESAKLSKFRTRNWVEINDDVRSRYSPNKQIRLKTSMLRFSLCDYRNGQILVKGNITVNNTAAANADANNNKKKYLKIVLHLLIAQVKQTMNKQIMPNTLIQ